MTSSDSPVQRASEAFVAEFARWRIDRGMSKKQLAAAMGFDASYVSHVEARRHRPTEDFARRAEAILQSGGAIWQRYKEYDELRATARSRVGLPGRDPPVPDQWLPPGTGLVVERETARLSYVDGKYRCTVRRALYNAGTEPVTRYLVRISVDRYPDDPARSNRHHRDHPMSWDELAMVASCAGEPMDWRSKTDRDALKEAWLLFENAQGRFPLYPGQRTTIAYSWHISVEKWGHWFQRTVRLPTRQLTIEVEFPARMRPVVWGVQTSLSAEEVPLRTPITQELSVDGRAVFSWHTEQATLHDRYRLEWRFRGTRPEGAVEQPDDWEEPPFVQPASSDAMRAAGVIQRGDAGLDRPVRRLDLPGESARAEDVIEQLATALNRIEALHPFVKGVGLAAPQLGSGLAVAVIRAADPDTEQIVLINPRVVAESSDADEQFEGCLSFFDVRGLVRRPLRITVESELLDGSTVTTVYDQALARLVAHEIDHLDGRLYVDRMEDDAPLVPTTEYRQTGKPWHYA
ncbi:peptide deformylase [Dactylosporangium sp. NPDC006015]|uniref:peptide deformylase n=1 Tax=Dactylosporangium sp. NPDC006015 TaxID=3154576 RepID=UPI0033A750C2